MPIVQNICERLSKSVVRNYERWHANTKVASAQFADTKNASER